MMKGRTQQILMLRRHRCCGLSPICRQQIV